MILDGEKRERKTKSRITTTTTITKRFMNKLENWFRFDRIKRGKRRDKSEYRDVMWCVRGFGRSVVVVGNI